MLRKLLIRNYQKHNKIRVDFSPTVTTIIGRSDAGKSAVLRALRWLCLNVPDGDGFIRHGQKTVWATLDIEKHRIGRMRAPKKNVYRLNDQEFVSFGRGQVPNPVASLLNVGSINFQRQMDGPYWLDLSAGEMSRELNKIVALEQIDSSLAAAASEVRRAKSEQEHCEGRLKENRTKRDELEWTVAATAKMAEIDGIQESIARISRRIDSLASLLSRAREAQLVSENAANAAKGAGKALSLAGRALKLSERCRDLAELLDRMEKTEAELCLMKERRQEVVRKIEKLLRHKCPICQRPTPSRSVSPISTCPTNHH